MLQVRFQTSFSSLVQNLLPVDHVERSLEVDKQDKSILSQFGFFLFKCFHLLLFLPSFEPCKHLIYAGHRAQALDKSMLSVVERLCLLNICVQF